MVRTVIIGYGEKKYNNPDIVYIDLNYCDKDSAIKIAKRMLAERIIIENFS